MSRKIRFDRRQAPLKAGEYPAQIRFAKLEGAGNDYIYVEELEAPIKHPAPLASRTCDRHFGVGGDGLVLVGRPDKKLPYPADFKMRIFSANGLEKEMCGNAACCAGKYLYDNGLTDKTLVNLQTGGGLRTLELGLEKGKVGTVRVNMGAPALTPKDIPMDAPGDNFIAREINVRGESYQGTAVFMGEPHLVVLYPDLDTLSITALGPGFERHPYFPKRVNTEFIEVKGRERLRLRAWERGSGETLACSAGACAALVACVLNGWTERKAVVELRGGELLIEWAADGNVYKTGRPKQVFRGEFFTG